jgi:hypothetical protein
MQVAPGAASPPAAQLAQRLAPGIWIAKHARLLRSWTVGRHPLGFDVEGTVAAGLAAAVAAAAAAAAAATTWPVNSGTSSDGATPFAAAAADAPACYGLAASQPLMLQQLVCEVADSRMLSSIAGLTQLTCLDLEDWQSGAQVTPASRAALASLVGLRELKLGHYLQYSSPVAKLIPALQHVTQLSHLLIGTACSGRRQQCIPSSVAKLHFAYGSRKLRAWDLSPMTSVTELKLPWVFEADVLPPKLQVLDVFSRTYESVMAPVAALQHLRELYLSDNVCADELRVLAASMPPSFTSLSLWVNRVSHGDGAGGRLDAGLLGALPVKRMSLSTHAGGQRSDGSLHVTEAAAAELVGACTQLTHLCLSGKLTWDQQAGACSPQLLQHLHKLPGLHSLALAPDCRSQHQACMRSLLQSVVNLSQLRHLEDITGLGAAAGGLAAATHLTCLRLHYADGIDVAALQAGLPHMRCLMKDMRHVHLEAAP